MPLKWYKVPLFLWFDLFLEGQKYKNIFVRFLVQMKTSKSHFEINWHLEWEKVQLYKKENIVNPSWNSDTTSKRIWPHWVCPCPLWRNWGDYKCTWYVTNSIPFATSWVTQCYLRLEKGSFWSEKKWIMFHRLLDY